MSGLSLFLGIPCSLIVNSPIQLLQAREAPTYSAGLSGVSQTGSRRRFHERGIGCEKMPSINSAPSPARARPRSCTLGGCWHGVRLHPSSKMLSSWEKGSRVPAASSRADVLLGVCRDGMLGGMWGVRGDRLEMGDGFSPILPPCGAEPRHLPRQPQKPYNGAIRHFACCCPCAQHPARGDPKRVSHGVCIAPGRLAPGRG